MESEILYIEHYQWKDILFMDILWFLLNLYIGNNLYFYCVLIVINSFSLPLMTKEVYFTDHVQFNYFYQSIPKKYYYSELEKITISNPMHRSKSMRLHFKGNKRLVLYYNPKLESLLERLKSQGVKIKEVI